MFIVFARRRKKHFPFLEFANWEIWVEVNVRINCPIKRIFVEMNNNQMFDMNDDIRKFCVSFVSIQVASFGLETVVASWNEHIIPGNKCFLFVLI